MGVDVEFLQGDGGAQWKPAFSVPDGHHRHATGERVPAAPSEALGQG
jgi:hypothetical protein